MQWILKLNFIIHTYIHTYRVNKMKLKKEVYIYIYVYIYVHIYIYIYIYIYIHTLYTNIYFIYNK